MNTEILTTSNRCRAGRVGKLRRSPITLLHRQVTKNWIRARDADPIRSAGTPGFLSVTNTRDTHWRGVRSENVWKCARKLAFVLIVICSTPVDAEGNPPRLKLHLVISAQVVKEPVQVIDMNVAPGARFEFSLQADRPLQFKCEANVRRVVCLYRSGGSKLWREAFAAEPHLGKCADITFESDPAIKPTLNVCVTLGTATGEPHAS